MELTIINKIGGFWVFFAASALRAVHGACLLLRRMLHRANRANRANRLCCFALGGGWGLVEAAAVGADLLATVGLDVDVGDYGAEFLGEGSLGFGGDVVRLDYGVGGIDLDVEVDDVDVAVFAGAEVVVCLHAIDSGDDSPDFFVNVLG